MSTLRPSVAAVVFLAVAVSASVASAAYDISADLAKAAFWKVDSRKFVAAHAVEGFKFTSVTRESATCLRPGMVTFAGLGTYETRVFFLSASGGVSRVEISLYNRGDSSGKSFGDDTVGGGAGKMDKPAFARLIRSVRAALTAEGAKPPSPKNEPLRNAGFVQKSQTWPKTDLGTVATLTWNCYQRGGDASTFRAEFARLVVTGPEGASAASGARTKRSRDVKSNVTKAESGDVYIAGVPMVDQGQKGYCAAATSERVMRYYGLSIDEHEIAQAAGTSAEGGTSVASMCESVAKVAAKFRMMKSDVFGAGRQNVAWEKSDYYKVLQAYNAAARKLRKSPITQGQFTHGSTIDIPSMMKAMDPEVLKVAKTTKMSGQYRRFREGVKKSVLAGQPLFWGVMLGIFSEPDIPQASGGHMRLIIGFNEKKGDILYSDSWGAGHEMKRMPMDNAWAITQTLFFLTPPR